MAKASASYLCKSCDARAVQWTGRCSRCGAFGTMYAASTVTANAGLRASAVGKEPKRAAQGLAQITASKAAPRITSGIGEFDRVLGGGLVAGQVMLLSGEPGAGKSTLLLLVANSIATQTGSRALYVSGEESVEQIAVRSRRIGVASPGLLLAAETDLAHVIGHIDAVGPGVALVIVDSVQTVASTDIDGRAGGVAQVMEVTQALTRLAKHRGIPICLVGQVTKESTVAGPRALEHLVDTTLSLDGDRHTSLRLLRAVKNRYGPADEVACFEQTDSGMREVTDPSSLFRGHREAAVPGTCVTVTVEGRRAMLAEVQALVAATAIPNPRRGVSGLDSSRVAMLTAVTERAAGLRLHDKDLFVATVGGIRLVDPSCDLAICLAIASAARGLPVPIDVAAIGEVTLSGDMRPNAMSNQRLTEAVRLGYRRVLAPIGTCSRLDGRTPRGIVLEVGTLDQALAAMARLAPRSQAHANADVRDRAKTDSDQELTR